MTKVLFIIDNLGRGGAQRQLAELVRSLDRTRYEASVISLCRKKTDYVPAIREHGISVTLINHRGTWSWRTLRAIYRKIRKMRPAIVHTWLFTADLYGRLAAILAGVKVISAMRNTVDDMPWHYRKAYQLLSLATSRVTINAEAIREGVVGSLKVPDRKIRLIYNGIDLEKFPRMAPNGIYRDEWRIPHDAKVVAMIARLSEQKDHTTFLKAASLVTEVENGVYFVLVGEGPLRAQVERLIKNLGLANRVRLVGPRQDTWELLNHVDLCVLATHFEGCSNVLMEAMAAGKPVIASRAGGNEELVIHGETGVLVPPRDPGLLADAMLTVLSDRRLSERMGAKGRERIEKHFLLDKTVSETEALYEEVLGTVPK